MKCPQCGYENQDGALCCNLCQNVLRREEKKAPASSNKLDYAAIAAAMVARLPKDPFLGGFGVLLDYSPASVAALDAFISEMYGDEGDSPDSEAYQPSKGKSNMIMEFGSYFGEAVRRQVPSTWQEDPEHGGQPLWTRLVLEDGTFLFPIARPFKRFKNGKSDEMIMLFMQFMQVARKADLSLWAPGFIHQAEHFLDKSALPESKKLKLASDFYLMAAALDPSKKESAQRRSALLLESLKKASEPAPPPEPAAPPPPKPVQARSPSPAPRVDLTAQAQAKYEAALTDDLLNRYAAAAGALRAFLRLAQPGQEAAVEDAKRRLPALEAFTDAFDPEHSLETCVEKLKNALLLEPGRVEARRELAVGLCMLKRFDEGLQVFDDILAAHPEHRLARQNKGAALSKMGRMAEAVLLFEGMLAQEPGDRGLWRNKAECLEQLGPLEKAMAFYDATVAADPAHELAWYAKAALQHRGGQAQAGESYRRFLMHVGRDTPPKLIAAAQRALWQDAHPGQTLSTVEAEAAAKRGGQAAMTGNFAAALPLFQEAVRLDETLANGWSNLGTVLACLGRFEESLAALTRACSLDPREQSSLKSRTSVLMELRRYEDAAQGWERLTQLWPQEAQHWRNRGWCVNFLQRPEEALSLLKEALRLKPGDPEIELEISSVLDRQGKAEESLALARRALDAAPQLRQNDGLAYLLGKNSSPAFRALLKG